MTTLAFCSFGTSLEAGLSTPEGTYTQYRQTGLHHNQVLLPIINTLLRDADLTMKDVDLVACSRGPGSFTALRILLSTAKGLAAGSGAGFITLPTFDLAGHAFSWTAETVVPYIDGKKQKIYAGFYRGGKKLEPEADIPLETLIEKLGQYAPVLLVGHAPGLFRNVTDAGNIPHRMIEKGFRLLHSLIALAEGEYEKGVNHDKLTPPLYIRRSDAELMREEPSPCM